MGISKSSLKCQNHKLAASLVEVIPTDTSTIKEKAYIAKGCKYSGYNNDACRNCLGVCVKIQKEVFNKKTKDIEQKVEYLRDTEKELKATTYINKIESEGIYYPGGLGYKAGYIKNPWGAGDRADNWFEICKKCKNKVCKKAYEDCRDKNLLDNQQSHVVPEEYKCIYDKQKKVFV